MTLASPWPLPLAFTSWAFNKTNGQPVDRDAVYNMTRACQAMGADTIAVQITEGITRDEVASLRRDMDVVAWCRCDNTTWRGLYDSLGPFDGLMPQIESHGQYDAALAALQDIPGPASIITDWVGYDNTEMADRIRATGCESVFVEAYADGGSQHADLPHYVVEFGATRGYAPEECIPCVGTYRQELPSAYVGMADYGSEYSVYLLEPMSPDQLQAWNAQTALGPGQPPTPPNPPSNGGNVTPPPTSPQPTAGEARAATTTAARFWETKVTQPDPESRATNSRRIANSTDDTWAKARANVRKALDDAGVAP